MMFDPIDQTGRKMDIKPCTYAYMEDLNDSGDIVRYHIGESTCRAITLSGMCEWVHMLRRTLRFADGNATVSPTFYDIFGLPWHLGLYLRPTCLYYDTLTTDLIEAYLGKLYLAKLQALKIFRSMVCKEDYYWFIKHFDIHKSKTYLDSLVESSLGNCENMYDLSPVSPLKVSQFGLNFSYNESGDILKSYGIQISSQQFRINKVLPPISVHVPNLKDLESRRAFLAEAISSAKREYISYDACYKKAPILLTAKLPSMAQSNPFTCYILYGLYRNIFLSFLAYYGPLISVENNFRVLCSESALSAALTKFEYRMLFAHIISKLHISPDPSATNFRYNIDMDRTGFAFDEYARLLRSGAVYAGISTPSKLETSFPVAYANTLEDFREGFIRRKYKRIKL